MRFARPQPELGSMWMAYTCIYLPSPEPTNKSRDRKLNSEEHQAHGMHPECTTLVPCASRNPMRKGSPDCTGAHLSKNWAVWMAYTCTYLPSPEDVSIAKCIVKTVVPAQQPNRY